MNTSGDCFGRKGQNVDKKKRRPYIGVIVMTHQPMDPHDKNGVGFRWKHSTTAAL